MIKNIFFCCFFIGCFAVQSQEKKEVLKVFTFEEVEKLHQKNPKPIVVFVYTDWCKICHGMKKNTFKNEEVIRLLNDKFYFIKLNAESKKDIVFLEKTFVYRPTGKNTGVHELANELASIKKRIAYPTTTILNSKFEIDLQLDGYVNSKKMKKILINYLL